MSAKKWIHIEAEKCTGCRLCEMICSYHNAGVLALARSRIKVSYYSPGFDVPTFCRQCDAPPCLSACPRGAISRRKRKLITIDEALCDGCGKCVLACPYDGIFIDPETEKAINCTFCGQCVKECPVGCLTFQEGKELRLSQDERARQVRDQLFGGLDRNGPRKEIIRE